MANNVMGGELQPCSTSPMTGFFRTGCCDTGPEDLGQHTVCAVMTDEFLTYSKRQGNDLTTPMPQYQFPGLKAGDRWCLCAGRWQEAFEAGCAPMVVLAATHQNALNVVRYEDLVTRAMECQDPEPSKPVNESL